MSGLISWFHNHKIKIPPYLPGDYVRFIGYSEEIRLLYNKEYPSCVHNRFEWLLVIHRIYREVGFKKYKVIKIEEGTDAAGGFYVYLEGIINGYHSNLFKKIIESKIK